MNQHSTRGINQAGERQARQGMRGTAGQAQTLRETGRRKPARKYPFLSVCGIFAISQRRQEKAGSLAPSAFAGCLPMVCRWSAGRMAARCLVQIMGGGEYAIKKDSAQKQTPRPLYASSPRRRKRRRAHGAGISGARPGRGAVFTCPRPIYLYIES